MPPRQFLLPSSLSCIIIPHCVRHPLLLLLLLLQGGSHRNALMVMGQTTNDGASASTPASGITYFSTPAAATGTYPPAGTPTPTPTTNTSSPFCLMCGFNFGHIMDGVDNQVAGMLLVAMVIVVLCLMCLLIGCCCCGRSGSKKGAYSAPADDDEAD
jgi:hypothetical protein